MDLWVNIKKLNVVPLFSAKIYFFRISMSLPIKRSNFDITKIRCSYSDHRSIRPTVRNCHLQINNCVKHIIETYRFIVTNKQLNNFTVTYARLVHFIGNSCSSVLYCNNVVISLSVFVKGQEGGTLVSGMSQLSDH